MKAEKFTTCCGAAMFSEFGYDLTLYGDKEPGEAEIIAWLDKNEDHQRKAMGCAMVVLTLNDKQYQEIGHIFLKRGYVCSEPMFHPKHSTRLYLLYKTLTKDPGEDVVPFYSVEDFDGDAYDDGHGWGRSLLHNKPELFTNTTSYEMVEH